MLLSWQARAVISVALALAMSSPSARAETAASRASFDERVVLTTSDVGAEQPAKAGADAKPIAVPSDRTPLLRSLDAHAGFRALIETEAKREGLAPEIAEAVMAVESGFNPVAVGGVGEIGLMQVLPSTARMLGFSGSNAELAVPATNIRYGVTYLAQAWRRAGGDLCTAVMKYRAGHGETRFSYRSVDYCVAVRGKLAARGFRVTGVVPVATFGEPGGGGCRKRCLGSSGRVNFAALNTQLGTLVAQARAGR